MRQVIEAYALILTIALLSILAVAFTSINLNIVQARRIYNDVRTEVQASNGAIVPTDTNVYDSRKKPDGTLNHPYLTQEFLNEHHYCFMYTITREPLTPSDHNITQEDETFIYNSIYRINFVYVYIVPLFGRQYYPIVGYVA